MMTIKNITPEEKQELVEQLIKSDIQLLYKEAEIITLPLLEQVLTKDEYNQLKEQTLSNMNSFIHHILNEGTAPGKPMDYWLPDGWLVGQVDQDLVYIYWTYWYSSIIYGRQR